LWRVLLGEARRLSGLVLAIDRSGGYGGGGRGRGDCSLWAMFIAMLLQLFYYCVKDLIRRFYVIFVEMVVVCDFFMYVKSLYRIEEGSFFLEI